jgi:hypothetical protein
VAKVSCPVSGSGHPDHAEGSDELRRCLADEKEAEKRRRDERIAAMLRPVPVQEPALKVVDPRMVAEGEVSGLSFAERRGAVGNPLRAREDSDGPSFGW